MFGVKIQREHLILQKGSSEVLFDLTTSLCCHEKAIGHENLLFDLSSTCSLRRNKL